VQRALRILPRFISKTVSLIERRCFNCNHRICDAIITDGIISIKCSKCGQVNYVVGEETEKKKIS
jgi:phage FluMu protein Com